MISLDTETTGLDLFHGARPFFLTICCQDGSQQFWEWPVDPLTREVEVPEEDAREIRQLLAIQHDGIALQNSKFDATALKVADITDWSPLWELTEDTLIAGHLLASNKPHDLTSMALDYLGIDILPYEQRLEKAVQECRRWCRSHLPQWQIASKDLPEMPSAKEKTWKYDTWLPKALAQEQDLLEGHPYWTVLREYANTDSAVTLALWAVMEKEIHRRGLWKIYRERMNLLPIIVGMEERGVTLSKARLEELKTHYRQMSEEEGQVCRSIAASYPTPVTAGEPSLFDSHELEPEPFSLELPRNGINKSLRTFCFDVLKLPPIRGKKSKTSAPTLDKNALEYYALNLPANNKAKAFIDSLRSKRRYDTGLAYLDSYERFCLPLMSGDGPFAMPIAWKPEGGRNMTSALTEYANKCGSRAEFKSTLYCEESAWFILHPILNPCGTDTLRCSCQNPNTQQISKLEATNLRYCFGPAPGREWWSLDAKNIELRIPAYESGEEDFIALFEREDDPPYYGSNHLLIAHLLFPREFEACRGEGNKLDGRLFKKKYASSLYQRVKNGDFAVQYGAVDREDGQGTADRTYGLPGAQAKIKNKFKKQDALNQKWIAFAERHGYVETIPDRSVDPSRGYPLLCSRTEYGRIKPTVPLNYHVQGTAMWWTLRAMVRCYQKLEEWRQRDGFDGYIVMQVHDEIVFDFPKGADPMLDRACEDSGKVKFRISKDSNLWRIRVIQKLMEQGGQDIGVPTPVGVEYHVDNWSEGITF